jgi:hypothetical protein
VTNNVSICDDFTIEKDTLEVILEKIEQFKLTNPTGELLLSQFYTSNMNMLSDASLTNGAF